MAAENTEAAFSGQKPDLVAGIAGNAAKVFHTHIILSVQGNKHGSFCQIIRELERPERFPGIGTLLFFHVSAPQCLLSSIWGMRRSIPIFTRVKQAAKRIANICFDLRQEKKAVKRFK